MSKNCQSKKRVYLHSVNTLMLVTVKEQKDFDYIVDDLKIFGEDGKKLKFNFSLNVKNIFSILTTTTI